MGFRQAAKVDQNQAQIVRELRAIGFRVDIVHRLKKLYDLVVTGKKNIWVVRSESPLSGFESEVVSTIRVEIKMPGEKLSPDEKEYHDAEPFPETLIIAYSTEDILKWFGRI